MTRDLAAPESCLVLQRPFASLGGHQWQADLPRSSTDPSDSNEAPAASSLALFENGAALGPRHAVHAEIAELGAGRYSHWDGALRFSTSDGSDPNTNGRRYAVAPVAPSMRILALGSCNLYQAVMRLHGRAGILNLWPDAVTTYSLREHLQLLSHYSGRAPIPSRLQPFTVAARLPPSGMAADGVDLLFLELGSCIDIGFAGIWLARTELLREIVEKVAALGREQHRLAYRWYNQGLIRQSETVRQSCIPELLAALPMIETDHVLAREIIQDARGDMQDMDDQRAALAEIIDIVRPGAVCVVSAQNAYTPDGRPLSWPVNYPKQLEALCASAGVALLHPSDLVAQYGAAFALSADTKHFTDAFIGVLAQAMLHAGRHALTSTRA